MSKISKRFVVLICLFILASCKNESLPYSDEADFMDYPIYTISEYNKMDTYVFNETIDNIKYSYTYFFEDDMCVNAKEELTFLNKNLANDFYKEIVEDDMYLEIKINGSIVSYYYNPEYFAYMMYPKDMLLELLNKEHILED